METTGTNVLLIGGMPNSGKTDTVLRLAWRLINDRGFIAIAGDNIPPVTATGNGRDFSAILRNENSNIILALNSRSDYNDDIDNFLNLTSTLTCNTLISAIRDDASAELRNHFLTEINRRNPNFTLEIPISRIATHSTNWRISLNWYQQRIDELIDFILSRNPFGVFNP